MTQPLLVLSLIKISFGGTPWPEFSLLQVFFYLRLLVRRLQLKPRQARKRSRALSSSLTQTIVTTRHPYVPHPSVTHHAHPPNHRCIRSKLTRSSFIRHSSVFAWCPMWALVRCFALPALIANAKIGSGRFLADKFSRAEIPYRAFRQHFVEELPRDCS